MKYCIKRALSVALALMLAIGMLTGIIVPASATERPVEHVVVIGLDGAGCLYNASTPNINKLMSTGASSMGCLVNYPTISGVNWTSMLNGVTYWEHGVNNDNIYGTPYTSTKYPSIFKVVRDAWPEAVLSSYVNWASPNRGAIENDIGVNKRDFWHENGADYEDSLLTAAAVEHIAEASPNLFFMQFDSIDAVGHSDGHDTDAQRAQITKVDGYIGQILDAIDANPKMKDNTIVILSADHGGDGKGHGLYLENSSKVFYVVAGKGINHNTDLGTMYLRDTPAIVAHALGVAGNPNWDSYIPKNLFIDDMTPPERNALREAASKATPAADSEKYIGNHIDLDDLKAGYFFDAALEDITDNTRAESKGLVTYFDGYYGNSAHVSGDGYIAFDELTFGEESFSIALWVKRKPIENTDPPLYGNKDWNKGANPGFTFALYNGESRNSLVALADGTNRSDLAQPGTGTVQMDNWVHTLLVVDRSADKAFFYENFQKISEVGITKLGSLDSAYDFVLGRSGPDNYKRVPDALVDDLLIFNGAVSAQEIENLATYYGVEIPEDDTSGESTVPSSPSKEDEKYIGNFISLKDLKAGYFFDDELVDITGNTEAVVEGSRLAVYEEGYYGKSVRGSATNYITIGEGEEMKNLNFTGTNGLDSFSIALWVKRDYTKTVDIALYGNKNWNSGKNQGIVGGVCSGPTRGTTFTCLADGSNRVDVNNKNNTTHAYSSDWVHTLVVVDRTAKEAYLYENFELVAKGDISKVGSLSTDLPFTVGRSGGVNLNTRIDNTTVLMDDLLIFTKAVGAKEIHALESYYGKATKHNWNTEYTIDVEPTCTTAGSKSIHCADCNVQKVDSVTTIPVKAHTEETVAGKEPTCTETGLTEGKKCSVCDATLVAQTEIAAKGHGETEVKDARAATCSAEGYTGDTYCTVCDAKIADGEAIPATGKHSYDKGVVTKEPTTSKEGVKTFTCTVCGTTKTEKIKKLTPKVNFTDVKKSDFYYEAVQWAVEQSITTGTSKTEFSPAASCTRAQAVTFLWRAAGQPTVKNAKNPFTDVKKSDYYYKAVLWAVEKGITKGTSATTFSPEESCTRGQIVTFLWRAQSGKKVSASNPFKDVQKSDFYYNAVLWAVKSGVTTGTASDRFSPAETCTRGQIVTFLFRAKEN